MPRTAKPSRAGRCSPVSLLWVFLAALASAPLLAGWGETAHEIVAREALRRLPPPLATRLARDEQLNAVLAHVMDPDNRSADLGRIFDELKGDAPPGADPAALSPQARAAWTAFQEERARHFFDIDALTDEPPPFPSFPRARADAEKHAADYLLRADRPQAARLLGLEETLLPQAPDAAMLQRLGAAAIQKHGALPWTIHREVQRLQEIFRETDLDRLPEAVGNLAHYLADLHQPLHTTRNYDGKETGNVGVHMAFEINIIRRHKDYYADIPAAYMRPYEAVADVMAAVFDRAGRNALLVPKIMAADSAARAESRATPQDFAWMKEQNRQSRQWLDSLMDGTNAGALDPREARLVKHADALHRILQKDHDDLARRCLGEASSTLASLIYTAWLHADRPPLAEPVAAQQPEKAPDRSWIPLLPMMIALVVLLLVLSRRRRRRPPPAPPTT